jgi:hypothetical protein
LVLASPTVVPDRGIEVSDLARVEVDEPGESRGRISDRHARQSVSRRVLDHMSLAVA